MALKVQSRLFFLAVIAVITISCFFTRCTLDVSALTMKSRAEQLETPEAPGLDNEDLSDDLTAENMLQNDSSYEEKDYDSNDENEDKIQQTNQNNQEEEADIHSPGFLQTNEKVSNLEDEETDGDIDSESEEEDEQEGETLPKYDVLNNQEE